MRHIALLAAFLLTGCAALNGEEPDFTCPKTGLIADAATIAYPAGAAKEAVVVQAGFDGFTGNCRFKKHGEVWVDISLPIVARKGAAAPADLKSYEFPYFIAVLSADEKVLQRQSFSTKVDFDNERSTILETEDHLIKIPVDKPEDAYKYKIAIGFELPQPLAPPAPAVPVEPVKKTKVKKKK